VIIRLDAESISMKELVAMADAECLDLWENLRLGYTECRGLPQLRVECAKDYPGLTAENILCFAGAEEGIYCTFKAILEPTDHVIVITPCYQSLKSIPESFCSVSSLDLSFSDNWSLDLDALRQLVKPGQTKLIVVNFPHNPTGTVLTIDHQQALIALAREYGLWLFCDEVYRGIERDPSRMLPTMASAYEKGLSLGAVSKVYGLAGLRVGWLCCRDIDLINSVSDNKHYLSICNSGPSEVLALIAMRERERVVGRNRNIVMRNEQYLAAFMAKYPKLLEWTPPIGGCCGYVKIHLPVVVPVVPVVPATTTTTTGTGTGNNIVADASVNVPPALSAVPAPDLTTVAERLVHEHGVLILPGDGNFPISSPGNNAVNAQHFRIGLGRVDFPAVLDAFEVALAKVLGQPLGL